MALLEKDGVRFNIADEETANIFKAAGYKEVVKAAGSDKGPAVSSSADEKAESKSVARRKRIQKQR